MFKGSYNLKILLNICLKSNFRNYRLKMFQVSNMSENSPFNKIWTKELNQLVTLFSESNFEIRIAGGAVRDILMNIDPHDIDFATDATPEEMKILFNKHEIRIINANGESHGTITPRINDKENFEITTLRIDKVTDGRRAEVEFTKDWEVDAERRDLTINAMFLDKNGNVYDYFNGYDDIKNRIVRFVGDPAQRIREDYLRILRYFRFYGRIAEKPDNHSEETINKIRENREGLKNISGERIWMEMKKIISGNFAPEIISKMNDCELLSYIGLPKNPNLSYFKDRHPSLRKNNSHYSVFFSTIFNNEKELEETMMRLKFSKDEYILSHFMLTRSHKFSEIMNQDNDKILTYFKDEFVMHRGEPSLAKLKICFHEYFKCVDRLDIWSLFEAWKPPRFPINGFELGSKWDIKGKRLGKALWFLKQKWHESNYTANIEDLIDNDTNKLEFMNSEMKN